MALFRISLAFSLLLLSLLAIASAGNYGDTSYKYGADGLIPADSPQAKYGFVGIPADNPQAKPDDYKPKPVDNEKPGFDNKPDQVYQPKPEGEDKPNYDTKQDIYKPKREEKSEEKEKSDYDSKPYTVKPKPEEEEEEEENHTEADAVKPEEQYDYDSKPNTEEKEKPEFEKKPYDVTPAEPKVEEKPYFGTKPDEEENQFSVAAQGLVLCKSGSTYYPIKGAFATITCKAVDEVGVENTVSVCSEATDDKGYFFATIMSHCDKLKLKECKAYLRSSPLQTCNVATNVNKAIEGALLSGFHVLPEKKMKLYSVKPFFYTSEAKAAAPQYGY